MKKLSIENLEFPELDMEQLYYNALFIAFKHFLDEEKKGNIYTELRLVKAIEVARTLYRVQR